MIFTEGTKAKPLEALLKDLVPSKDDDDAVERKRDYRERIFMSRVCTKAAFNRVKALEYFDDATITHDEGSRDIPIKVLVKEPKTHWKLKVSANAPASNIRKAMCSVSWTRRNFLGRFGEINGCLAVSPHSLRDIEGEVSYMKHIFLCGGRRSLSKWVSKAAPHNGVYKSYLQKQSYPLTFYSFLESPLTWIRSRFFAPKKLTEEEKHFAEEAVEKATGEPGIFLLGGRIEQCDKGKVCRLKKHSATAFATLKTANYGSMGVDLTSYSILPSNPSSRKGARDTDLDGVRFRPHVRGWYKPTVGNWDEVNARAAASGENVWDTFGWGVSYLTEFMARIPCPGARHYRDPKHGTSFLRNTVSGIVRVPLRRVLLGKVGLGLEVFGQCGLLTGIRNKDPSSAMAALEEFENNSGIVRNLSLSMIPPNMKLSNPVTGFYSVNTTVGGPVPFFRSLSLAGFFDVGGVTTGKPGKKRANRWKPRATAGIGLRFQVMGGNIEITLGTPLAEVKGEDDPQLFGVSSAYSLI